MILVGRIYTLPKNITPKWSYCRNIFQRKLYAWTPGKGCQLDPKWIDTLKRNQVRHPFEGAGILDSMSVFSGMHIDTQNGNDWIQSLPFIGVLIII